MQVQLRCCSFPIFTVRYCVFVCLCVFVVRALMRVTNAPCCFIFYQYTLCNQQKKNRRLRGLSENCIPETGLTSICTPTLPHQLVRPNVGPERGNGAIFLLFLLNAPQPQLHTRQHGEQQSHACTCLTTPVAGATKCQSEKGVNKEAKSKPARAHTHASHTHTSFRH